jgi:hypothetical protein
VTISYVGAPQLTPLRARRAALKEAFGFDCGCPRCAAEAGLYERSDVGELIEGVAEVRRGGAGVGVGGLGA